MSLGDFFSEGQKGKLAKDTFALLELGTVFYMHVDDTKPPKTKYFIVVGKNDECCCFASIYINSNINKNVNYKQVLRDLHIPLLCKNHTFLQHDSYANCSNIHEKEFAKIVSDEMTIIDELIDEETLQIILKTIREAETISPKQKNKFGLI